MNLIKAAGVGALGTVMGATGLTGYALLAGMEWAQSVFMLVVGGMMGIVSGLFASSTDKIVFEQPSGYKAKVHITAEE